MTELSSPHDTGMGPLSSRATSYDVARLAGVSQSAVSRAFRVGASISKAKRDKVEKAALALGYQPSNIARSLITQRTRMVGVVMTDTTVRNTTDILRCLSDAIQLAGNRMLLCTVPTDREAAEGVADLLAFHVDGIISSAALQAEVLTAANRQRVPVVLFNRVPSGMFASSVACDHAAGMATLVAHLAGGNMARTVLLAGPEGAPVSEERIAGARNALAARALSPAAVLHSDYSYEGGRSTVLRAFSRANFPGTLICVNDAMALGAIDALRFDLGLAVPGDVQVCGFDDVPQSSWPSYALTTLRQPVRHMADACMRLLLDKLEGTACDGERRLMPAELQPRGSTRANPQS